MRDGVLAPGSLALGEVLFLLYDELREPCACLAILEAIGNGNHTFKAIKDAELIGDMHLPAYLSTLQDMRYVERRLPATIPPSKVRTARRGSNSPSMLRFGELSGAIRRACVDRGARRTSACPPL